MQELTLSGRLVEAIEALEQGETLEDKVTRLTEQALRRRLARYQLVDRLMRGKYGMSLEEFEASEMVQKLGYTFAAESDHQDWDLAVDGIRSMERRLAELQSTA